MLLEIYNAYKRIIHPSETSIIILDEALEIDGWEHFVRGYPKERKQNSL